MAGSCCPCLLHRCALPGTGQALIPGGGGGRAACVTWAGSGYRRCHCHWLLPQRGVQAVGVLLTGLCNRWRGRVGGKERRLASGLHAQEEMKSGPPPCLPPLCLYPHPQTPGLLQ